MLSQVKKTPYHRINRWCTKECWCIHQGIVQRACQERSSRVFSTGWTDEASVQWISLTDECWVSSRQRVRRPTASFGLWETGLTGGLAPDEPTVFAKMLQRLQTTTSSLWPIYMALPVIWSLLDFLEAPYTPKNTSKLSKNLVIKSLVLTNLWEC